MEYTEINQKWLLIHDEINIINISYIDSGKLWKSNTGNRVYYITNSEDEINLEINRLNLKAKWEGDMPFDFENNYRFKIKKDAALEDNDLFQLVNYAKTNQNINYKLYANYIVVYVDWFYQNHYDLLISKDIYVEINSSLPENHEIDARQQQ